MRTQGPARLGPGSLVHLCLKKKKWTSPLSLRLSVGGKVDPSDPVPGSGVNGPQIEISHFLNSLQESSFFQMSFRKSGL